MYPWMDHGCLGAWGNTRPVRAEHILAGQNVRKNIHPHGPRMNPSRFHSNVQIERRLL